MLLNKKENRVKFVSYTGEYPNLCSGVLTLEIDGKQYKFGHDPMNHHYDESKKKWIRTDEDENNPNYESLWRSGGTCYFTNDYQDSVVETNEWYVNYRYAKDIADSAFTDNRLP
jgi:hypothetical protein